MGVNVTKMNLKQADAIDCSIHQGYQERDNNDEATPVLAVLVLN